MAKLKDLLHRLVSGESREQTGHGNERKSREEDEITQTTLAVEGMSCGHCKAAVEGELGKLSGVESSEADFEKNTVEVRYDAARATTDDLRGAIEEAGYKVTG